MHIGRPPFLVERVLGATPEMSRLSRRELPPGMPAALIDEVEAYIAAVYEGAAINRNKAELPCFWLDLGTGLCRNYEFRPKVCREMDCREGGYDCPFLKDSAAHDQSSTPAGEDLMPADSAVQ